MYWQLALLSLFPVIPVNPTFFRIYDTSKFRIVFECDSFETLYEFGIELVKENRQLAYDVWKQLRKFYSDTPAAKKLA
jgi:hypothetical protein